MASKTKRSIARTSKAAPQAAQPSAVFWCGPAVITAACILTYWNSLSGPFILDDLKPIVGNPQIRELWHLGQILSTAPDSSVAGRPIVNLSLAINYALGGVDVVGYHLGNLAVHIGCALTIFGIVRRTLEFPSLAGRFGKRSIYLAFFVSLIWAVHPLNSEAVDYIIQRTESMAGLFFLFALYASARALGSRQARWWQLTAVGSSALGMATKESVAVLPLVIVLYDSTFVFQSIAQALRARPRFYACLAATWVVLIPLLWSGPRSEAAGFSTGVSPWTYLLDQAVIVPHYLRLAFWPRGLVAFYGWPLPLTLAGVLPQAILIVLLTLLTGVALIRWPTLGFLGAWFFITLAPTSSIVPVATEVGAERRMYLPLIAVVALTIVAGEVAWNWIRIKISSSTNRVPSWANATPVALTAAIVVLLATATIARNREYESAVTLARTVVDRRPTSIAHHILGVQLMEAGQHDQAELELRRAVSGNSQARYDLGVELLHQRKTDEAVAELEAFVATWHLPYRLVPHWLEPSDTQVVSARMLIGRAVASKEQWARAIEQFQAVLKIVPSNPEAQKALADALFGQQSFEKAIEQYRTYLQSSPNDAGALNYLGISLVARDKLDEAISAFNRAVAADPRDGRSERNLATALMDRQDVANAHTHAERAVALMPDDPMARDLFGRTLALQGRFDEARVQFEAALRADPAFGDARGHLARLPPKTRAKSE